MAHDLYRDRLQHAGTVWCAITVYVDHLLRSTPYISANKPRGWHNLSRCMPIKYMGLSPRLYVGSHNTNANTRIHEYEYTNMNTRIHDCEYTNINTRILIHEYTNTRIHEYTNTRLHDFEYEYTNTRIHEYTNTTTHLHDFEYEYTNTNARIHLYRHVVRVAMYYKATSGNWRLSVAVVLIAYHINGVTVVD